MSVGGVRKGLKGWGGSVILPLFSLKSKTAGSDSRGQVKSIYISVDKNSLCRPHIRLKERKKIREKGGKKVQCSVERQERAKSFHY